MPKIIINDKENRGKENIKNKHIKIDELGGLVEKLMKDNEFTGVHSEVT